MSRLELAGVSKRYGALTALDAVNLVIPPNSRMAILGPSGCGKTTLLRLVAGFEAPDSGRIRLGDDTLAEGPVVVQAHRRRIGIVMQDGALFPHLNVGDNIAFGLDRRVSGRHRRVEELMHLVSLPASMAQRRPDQLSGGQQQRVALARALAREPAVMLLDEPFSALDAGLRATTRDAIATLLADRGITAVLVTHDRGEALGFADQVAVMQGGRVRRVGSPREVYLRPGDAASALILGDAVMIEAEMTAGRAFCPLGALPVDARHRSGRMRLMLRPEQFRLVASGTEGSVTGQVVTSSFAGPTATLRVRLDADPAGSTITLRTRGFEAPATGQSISILIDGHAHVLDD